MFFRKRKYDANEKVGVNMKGKDLLANPIQTKSNLKSSEDEGVNQAYSKVIFEYVDGTKEELLLRGTKEELLEYYLSNLQGTLIITQLGLVINFRNVKKVTVSDRDKNE